MNEFLPKNSKEEIIKTMMRHPETAKLIKEALSSPIGSTSRAKAQKLFSIVNKLGSSHDGMGGPGYDPMSMYVNSTAVPPTMPKKQPKNMVVFKKIPKPRLNKNANKPKDGMGGPGIYDGKGGLWGNITSLLGDTTATFSKPFTDNIGTPNVTANSTTAVSPTIDPKSPSYIKPENYDPGLISKGLSWLGNTADGLIKTGTKTVLSGALAIPAAMQYAGQNLFQGTLDATRSLFPHDTSKSFGPGYTTLADTAAGQRINNLWPSVSSTTQTAVNNTSTTKPTSTYVPSANPGAAGYVSNLYSNLISGLTNGRPTTAPVTQPVNQAPTVTGSAPSFYASLAGGRTTAPFGANGSLSPSNLYSNLTQTVGGATGGTTGSFSGGATGLYSGGSTTPTSGGASGSFIERLIQTESSGNYGAVGPVLTAGENAGYAALGKYQIMPNLHFASIGLNPNSEADVRKFLDTPALQDQLFTKIIGDLSTKYNGDESKIAAAYFAGDRGAQAVGTPLGDTIGDGNLSVNQYVARLTGNAPTIGSAAQMAVNSGASSPTTFAMQQMSDPNNPITKGMLYSEAVAANRSRIWDEFNLTEDKERIEKLRNEVQTLPKDMTDYITARDTYIKETDQAISDYMKDMEKMDMSNPVVAKQATSHLNYLYTLRGRQNQSYMGYLNEAVVNHETKLNNAIEDYNSRLALAEQELTEANAITQEQYTMYSQSLAELYQSVQDAPMRALQLEALKNQTYNAATTGVTDQLTFDKAQGYFVQRDKLKGSIVDSDLLAIPGTNLVDQIGRIQFGDPSIYQDNILRAYEEGVTKFLYAMNDEKTGITPETKRTMAEEGIRNFAQVAAVGMQSGNDAVVTQGLTFASNIADNYSKNLAQNIVPMAPQLMEAIKTLAPGGSWYTLGLAKRPTPTMDQFVSTVKTNTNNNPLSESIAKAVYAVFLRYVSETGSTPEGAVTAMLNNVSSTSDRATPTPYTPEEFSNVLSRMYTEDLLMREFGVTPQLQQFYQMARYQ